MAHAFAKTILGIAASIAAAGVASAQPDQVFKEGITQLRLGNKEAAQEKFAEVLKLNPSHEDAYRIYHQTEASMWAEIAANGGEFQKLADYLLDRARVARKERSRDEAAIKDLVDKAMSPDFGVSNPAISKLFAEHGEFAVPFLVERMANADDDRGQTRAIFALDQLGPVATMPLVAALKTEDANLRRNVATALHYIEDRRAAPALAAIASQDSNEIVREVARLALAKLGVKQGATPVDLHLEAARHYLTNGVRDGEQSGVVWSFEGGKLVPTDVPPILYPFELAKQSAHAALALDPANPAAKATVARTNLAMATAIGEGLAANPNDEALKAAGEKAPALKMVAMATGPAALRGALNDSLQAGMIPVAVYVAQALGEAEDRDAIANGPLVALLDHPDKRVRYASALAISRATNGAAVPMADKVVAALGNAVTEEAVRVVKVIDPSPDSPKIAREATAKKRDVWTESASTGLGGVNDLLNYPVVDVVVINESLTDTVPIGVVNAIRQTPKLANAKILVVAKDPAKAAEMFGDKINGTIAGPLTAENLLKAVDEALQGVDIGASRARADEVAVGASNALSNLSVRRVDIAPALKNLAAQLNRGDSVARPAAVALGNGGGLAELEALIGTIKSEGASLDLKVDCANAIGKILGRSGEMPANLQTDLMSVVASNADARLRGAIVTALGRGNLAPGESLKLIEALKVVPGAAAEKKAEGGS